MANNKLILRSVNSPWVTPFNDVTTNSVLSWGDVDNNFIYLKGELIYSGFTSNNQLILQKINGSQITINGIGGGSSTDIFVTGGTYSNGTAIFTNNTGGTFNVNGFFTGSTDVFVTGGTYDNNTGVATFTDSSGNTFNVNGFLTGYTNYYTTGATLNDTILSFDRTDSLSAYTVDLSSLYNYGNKWFVPSGTTVEVKENYQSFIYGDLYIQGTLLLNDNAQLVVLNGDIILSGGSISGNGTTLLIDLPMFDTHIIGGNYSNGVLSLVDNFGNDVIVSGFFTGSTDNYITGGTYSNGDLTLVDNFGNDVIVSGFFTGSTDNYLPLSGGVMYDNAIIQFDNASQLSEGTYDFGGQGGISQICGFGYENNWQSGFNHIFDSNGFIRESKYCFNILPDNNFDSNSRFKVGSRWVLDNGDVYICSDDTVGSAVWYLENNDTYVTGGTYFTGGTIIFDYNTGSGFQITGLTEDLNNEISGLAEADEQTITLNLTTNKIELKEIVASTTSGTRTFLGDFAISNGTLNLDTIGSGSPVINLGLDSSGFVVTGIMPNIFTGNTSGNCISDIYVSNIHSCSPLHINPNNEGDVYFGSTSGVTIDLTNNKLIVENLQITSGATNGYVLTSDANGNVVLTEPNNNFTYEIGEYVPSEGGVIFHRWYSNNPLGSPSGGTVENYLVLDTVDLSTGTFWSTGTTNINSVESFWDGLRNTNNLIYAGDALGITSSSAAFLCYNSTNNGHNDWYLPSIGELAKIDINLWDVSQGILLAGGTQINYQIYWSSTEFTGMLSWVFDFSSSLRSQDVKTINTYDVRAVRKFSV